MKGVILDAISNTRNWKLETRNTKLETGNLKLETSKQEAVSINFLHLAYIWPFPKKRVKAVLESAKKILLIENNKTGQLGELIRQETGIEIKDRFLKYDGRPPFREEIIKAISNL